MALYVAQRIIDGAMDYALIVAKYPKYKEDIDTILIGEGRQELIVNN